MDLQLADAGTDFMVKSDNGDHKGEVLMLY